jgi:DNA-binding GntR family transcriptional regulator
MSTQTQRDSVFERMKDDILAGVLKSGDPISEREYSKRVNVSRVPVREALIKLESRGLVTMRKAQGAFVRTFDVDEIRQLYEVREQLEGAAARLSVGRIDPAILGEIEQLLLAFAEARTPGQRDEIRQVNTSLHDAILAACGNALLQRMLGDVREQITLSRVWRFYTSSEEEILSRVEDHLSIIRAIRAGDGALAERAMRAHIAGWRKLEF